MALSLSPVRWSLFMNHFWWHLDTTVIVFMSWYVQALELLGYQLRESRETANPANR